MPTLKTDVFTFDRRDFLKLTSKVGVGIGAVALSPDLAFAQGMCDHVVIANGSVNVAAAAGQVQYWIDGQHFEGASDLPSRASISIFIDLQQTAQSFIEAVTLLDSNNRTMGARYFTKDQKLAGGQAPYAIFDDLDLNPTRTYSIVYTVRSGDKVKLYRARIVNPTLTRLRETWLPDIVRNDMAKLLSTPANAAGAVNPTPGLLTTPYQYYTANGLGLHACRAYVTALAANGDFQMQVAYMHPDANEEHFMRYFMVLDPVGRMLGLIKRPGPNAMATTGANGAEALQAVNRIDAGTISAFGISQAQLGNIADCPRIRVITEDNYDAIASCVIGLR